MDSFPRHRAIISGPSWITPDGLGDGLTVELSSEQLPALSDGRRGTAGQQKGN